MQDEPAETAAAKPQAETQAKTGVKVGAKAMARARAVAAEKARRDAERVKRWASENIESYSKFITRENEKLRTAEAEAAKTAEKWAEAWSLLSAAGFKPIDKDYPRWTIEVHTTQRRLKRLYEVLGRLDGEAVDKKIEDAEKAIIRVSMPSVEYPMVTVVFFKKLTAEDQCKIVDEVVPAKVEHKLVCRID